MHSRYSPATASTTLPQIRPAGLRPTSIPSSGTITIYRAVMNPALPTVVYMTPNCWAVAAAPSARPQSTPPFSRVRRAAGLLSGVRRLSRSSSGMAGSSTSPPIRNRAILKVKGPRWSMPTLWATKAAPQIRAVRSRISECTVTFLLHSSASKRVPYHYTTRL